MLPIVKEVLQKVNRDGKFSTMSETPPLPDTPLGLAVRDLSIKSTNVSLTQRDEIPEMKREIEQAESDIEFQIMEMVSQAVEEASRRLPGDCRLPGDGHQSIAMGSSMLKIGLMTAAVGLRALEGTASTSEDARRKVVRFARSIGLELEGSAQ
jgi:hypothetical protein